MVQRVNTLDFTLITLWCISMIFALGVMVYLESFIK